MASTVPGVPQTGGIPTPGGSTTPTPTVPVDFGDQGTAQGAPSVPTSPAQGPWTAAYQNQQGVWVNGAGQSFAQYQAGVPGSPIVVVQGGAAAPNPLPSTLNAASGFTTAIGNAVKAGLTPQQASMMRAPGVPGGAGAGGFSSAAESLLAPTDALGRSVARASSTLASIATPRVLGIGTLLVGGLAVFGASKYVGEVA